MDDFPIPEADRDRIESMVAQYRHQIENLYRMAYLQGQIEISREAVAEMRREHPLVSGGLAVQREIAQ